MTDMQRRAPDLPPLNQNGWKTIKHAIVLIAASALLMAAERIFSRMDPAPGKGCNCPPPVPVPVPVPGPPAKGNNSP